MLGQIGRPGCGFAFGHGSMNGMGMARTRDAVGEPAGAAQSGAVLDSGRAHHRACWSGRASEYDYNGHRLRFPDTRLMWWAGGNPLHHHQDLNRLLRAWARVDTMVVSEPWWNSLARHADIVLPATTTLERDDIGSAARDRFVLAMHQAVPQIRAGA